MSDRTAVLDELSSKTFDVLVIGGGITGAGIARDAAMRGLSVAVVDKGDFGSGTSSRSSRLIHGGVRYLEHGHLRLVFEASAERRRLLRIAPHLVRPLAFTWPVYTGQRMTRWKLSAGLTAYDLLALFRNVARHRRLNARNLLGVEPRLRSTDLLGGVRYFDAATDDARLTLANVVDARRYGAVAANHVTFTGAIDAAGGVRIARLEDALSGNRVELRALVFVNATGPWSDAVQQMETGSAQRRVQGSKGAHIAVRRERVGNNDAITMIHPRDGRVTFILPAGLHTIVGTTDTFTTASPDEVRANEGDVSYLLEAANVYFPEARLERGDVIAAWAGIRPLLPSRGSPASATREHLITTEGRSVVVAGGKLTTFRVMARQAVDAVQRVLRRPVRRAHTGDRMLPAVGGAESGTGDVVEGLPYRLTDLRRAVERELASTLGDLLIRRTHVAFETPDNGRAAARRVGSYLGWDSRELDRYDAEITRIFTIEA